MLSKIISLHVEEEHNHFTSAEFFNIILILWYENKCLDVQYFSAAVLSLDDREFKLHTFYL